MATKTLMTVEEFSRMHTAETEDFELVEGELIPLSSGTPRHAFVRDLAGDYLRSYLRRNRAGRAVAEVDCRIKDETIRRPDLSVFLGDRFQAVDLDSIPIPFAPDIAVEVLSASESAIDVHRKVKEYLTASAQEVWILDHVNGEVFVHSNAGIRLLQTGATLTSPLLPGFEAAIDDLFAGF